MWQLRLQIDENNLQIHFRGFTDNSIKILGLKGGLKDFSKIFLHF